MAKEKPDLVYGTLDMLILKALQHDPRHGLAIADRIQRAVRETMRLRHPQSSTLPPNIREYRKPLTMQINAVRVFDSGS